MIIYCQQAKDIAIMKETRNIVLNPGISALKMDSVSCPGDARLLHLQGWCLLAGHWLVREHRLDKRIINESVLIYCVNGSGHLTINEVTTNVNAGDVFYCPPGIEHGYCCAPSSGWEIWWVHFGGSQFNTLCQLAGLHKHPPLRLGIVPEILELFFVRLLDILTAAASAAALDANQTLHSLLMEILKRSDPQKKLSKFDSLPWATCSSLDELARNAGYSKYHFCRLFKQETGLSPWQFVIDRKIECARELLLSSMLSIKEISSRLGFNNPDYFAKIFARRTGITPHIYRGSMHVATNKRKPERDS